MSGHRDPSGILPTGSAAAHDTDPALLNENSSFKSYKTSRFEYPNLRIFFRQHPKAHELPTSPAPLPLLVCVPGLGGSVAQFHPLLTSLVDLAPCLAMDYPGGGRSGFEVTDWEAYTTEALMELLEVVIEDYRDKEAGQGVVLIGHSMGTILSAGLASKKIPHTTSLAEHVVGLVAICPVSGALDEAKSTLIRRLVWVPGWLFALWRAWDGMGGPLSPSVSRFVGEDAEPQLKILQHRFNMQSRTPVWRRMVYGALGVLKDGKSVGGLPGLDVWSDLDVPVYLIAGEKDTLTPPKELDKIVKAMESKDTGSESDSSASAAGQPELNIDSAAPVNVSTRPQDHIPSGINDLNEADFQKSSHLTVDDPLEFPSTPQETSIVVPPQPEHPRKVVQSIVMPAPANHTLLYMPRLSRALAGLVSDFLATTITQRLSLAWQLQYLSQEGKWDVKNLKKWTAVNPVSDAIGPPDKPLFRAMKTLREADEVHCPKELVARWGDQVKDVVDITLDQPVYDPRSLERAGVHYHKLPTVSKIPPQAHEVEAFIALVDKLRGLQAERAEAEGWDADKCVIAVHCHYGFNRTGYFVVCYMVERCGYALQDAIAEFLRARPNGIRHSHFLDRLYVRYNLDASQVAAA